MNTHEACHSKFDCLKIICMALKTLSGTDMITYIQLLSKGY